VLAVLALSVKVSLRVVINSSGFSGSGLLSLQALKPVTNANAEKPKNNFLNDVFIVVVVYR
jgi:hypothetical protein